jgi:hypothetical protein
MKRRWRLDVLERRDAPAVVPVGAEFRVNSHTTNVQSAPAVALDADGDAIVVWESLRDGSGFGIYGQRYDQLGAAVGGEFRINNYTTNEQRSPAVAMDATGGFVVVYESFGQDGSGYGIYARRYNNAGTAVGNEFLVNTVTTGSQIRPSVAMDSDGDFIVAWEGESDGDGPGIFFQRFNNAGTPVGVETRANVATTQFQSSPSVSMDADGNFVIVWQSYLQDGDGYGIYARRYNSAGTALGGEFRPNQVTTDQQQQPVVRLDADGDFVIAWESFGQDGSRLGIYARRYDKLGNALSNEFLVNTTTLNDQRSPSLAMAPNGDFVVAWTSFGQEPSSYGIYARRYLASGAADGGEFHVNTYTTGHQTQPAAAADGAGKLLIVWRSEFQDGSNSGIYGQRFQTAFPPKLQSLMINDGSPQRSRVTSLTVRFDQVVTFAGTPAAAFSVSGLNGGVTLGVDTVTLSSPTQTVALITFSGGNTTAGSLNDGNYTFTIIASQVSGPGGQFDGNGNGVGGDSFSFGFFRLYGDFNGDRSVTAADFAVFRLAYGALSNDDNYLWYADLDGNGSISAADFNEFRIRYGMSI